MTSNISSELFDKSLPKKSISIVGLPKNSVYEKINKPPFKINFSLYSGKDKVAKIPLDRKVVMLIEMIFCYS